MTRWDEAVAKGSATYGHHAYNFLYVNFVFVLSKITLSILPFVVACSLDNCHSYVAECLTEFPFSGRSTWNMVVLCFWMFFRGKYIDTRGFLKTWLPFALVALVATNYYVLH